MPRRLVVFAAALAAAALLWPVGGPLLGFLPFWGAALAAAAFLAVLAGPVRSSLLSGSTEFLCDSCKYNHERLCSRPERPNATECPDYRSR